MNSEEEVKPRRYGVWAGNKNGTPEDPARCIVELVKYNNGWPSYSQCRRKRGHGQDGLYCAQHGRSAP